MKKGRLTLAKIDGKLNPVDMLTKPLGATELHTQMLTLGATVEVRAA